MLLECAHENHSAPMKSHTANRDASRLNLQRLSIIRNIALGGQLLALFFFSQLSDINLPTLMLGILLAIYALVIGTTWWRSFRPPRITELEFFSHLLVDIVFFTALLYFSGGAANPFISYYLVPISIAAATLPAGYTWATTVLSLLAYSFLMNYNIPVPALMPAGHHDSGSNLHLHGMWVNFAISAGLITYFVTRMAKTVRHQEQQIAEQREDALRNDQVLAIGTLAAGTAHELGTPLNTMKILVDELVAEDADDREMKILQQQIAQCRQTLQQLVATAENSAGQHPEALKHYFGTLLERWQVMRPQLSAHIEIADDLPQASCTFHPTIAQSLLNLLNNAADASPDKVEVNVSWGNEQAVLAIRDYGSGIDAKTANNLGKPVPSDKPDGMGVGLFLAQASFNRFGGSLTIENAPDGGTLTTVALPLADRNFIEPAVALPVG